MSNVPELTVSELSFSLKKTLEDGYGRVRVRGELSKVKIHTSGHMYSDLKDADSLINLVCWKATVARLLVRPEEGLEVIVTGKVTTYPSRSNYQLVVEQIELAGEGALLKMLEDRRKRLAAEGLFDPDRKRPIPFLPDVIGVVTSPTGSVIRDILHRLEDRFPRRVLIWPVRVQGPGAAEEIAAALGGFCRLSRDGPVPRPDLVIVARGGGSLEDLMPFNEDIVVRAAAACAIPLISAVGHETDTTLIDYVSDRRAPTPTAAAEMAVPERIQMRGWLDESRHRLNTAMTRLLRSHRQEIATAAAHLKDPARILETRIQQLDRISDRLTNAATRRNDQLSRDLNAVAASLLHPRDRMQQMAQATRFQTERLTLLARHLSDRPAIALNQIAGRLDFGAKHRLSSAIRDWKNIRLPPSDEKMRQFRRDAVIQSERLINVAGRLFDRPTAELDRAARMLDVLSFKNVLDRGFAVIRDPEGGVVTSKRTAESKARLQIQFADGGIDVKPEI